MAKKSASKSATKVTDTPSEGKNMTHDRAHHKDSGGVQESDIKENVALENSAQENDELMLVHKALSAIPDDDLILTATEIFAALADSTRFRILSALSVGELCVSDLLCATEVSQSAVSHQLRFLRDKKLVRVRKEGQRSLYSLADDHVKSLINVALEHASE